MAFSIPTQRILGALEIFTVGTIFLGCTRETHPTFSNSSASLSIQLETPHALRVNDSVPLLVSVRNESSQEIRLALGEWRHHVVEYGFSSKQRVTGVGEGGGGHQRERGCRPKTLVSLDPGSSVGLMFYLPPLEHEPGPVEMFVKLEIPVLPKTWDCRGASFVAKEATMLVQMVPPRR
jgi:hypothetical protein